MKNFQQLKQELLKDPEIKKFYDDLEPEFSLAKKVIAKRIKSGLTQQELAEKIGTKQSAIARLESGSYNPSYLFLNKIAVALGGKLEISL